MDWTKIDDLTQADELILRQLPEHIQRAIDGTLNRLGIKKDEIYEMRIGPDGYGQGVSEIIMTYTTNPMLQHGGNPYGMMP